MSQDRVIPFPCPTELLGHQYREMAKVPQPTALLPFSARPSRMNDQIKLWADVRGCVRAKLADPQLYYFEVWTDLGGECRLAVKIGGPFVTRREAQRACEEAKRRYKAA